MSNTNFELKEDYPLEPEHDLTHDLSKGLRRHMPIGYDQLGRYREPMRIPDPIKLVFAAVLVVGALMIARVL